MSCKVTGQASPDKSPCRRALRMTSRPSQSGPPAPSLINPPSRLSSRFPDPPHIGARPSDRRSMRRHLRKPQLPVTTLRDRRVGTSSLVSAPSHWVLVPVLTQEQERRLGFSPGVCPAPHDVMSRSRGFAQGPDAKRGFGCCIPWPGSLGSLWGTVAHDDASPVCLIGRWRLRDDLQRGTIAGSNTVAEIPLRLAPSV